MTSPVSAQLPYPLAERLAAIEPFYVMELVKQADRLAAAGRSIIHLSIGEPDFTAPPPVLAALSEAMAAGRSGYTPAVGVPALREAIAAHYRTAFGVEVPASRIVVTAGASAALLLAIAVLVDAGQEVLLPDPSYPCNRHIIAAFNALPKLIPAGPEKRFQLDAADVVAHWSDKTRGVLLASPSNPTGTTIPPTQLAEVLAAVRRQGGFLIVDEIYQGLHYGDSQEGTLRSALALGDDVIVVNSFSKYFNMTGWRLGWLVVPEVLVAAVEKVAQNLFICASALAQHAALACFQPDALAIYEARRREFEARRDYLLPALREMGFDIPVLPDGAFYIYANVAAFGLPSEQLAHRLLHEAGVCCVPGRDFGEHAPHDWLRFSYATSLDQLREAVARMQTVLGPLRR